MKPTLSTIERRVAALETRSGADAEPIVLRVLVVYDPPDGEPNLWTHEESSHIYKGQRIVCVMPRLLTPEELAQQGNTRNEAHTHQH